MATHRGSEPKRSKYRLLGLVGQGQFGRVFCAAHRQTGRLAALKDLDRDRFPTAQFLRELRFLLSLQHPNIVTFQAVEHTATGRYLVMDYCEGGTLRSLMTAAGKLCLSQSLKLVLDILAGLEHAHAQQIIHCDIKPENILLNITPTGWTARISDFGIARLVQELNDPRLSNTGSPAYMAPERFYGQYSPTSDLYSVGILLYELLVGHRPFSGTPADLMTAHFNHPVTFPETVPEVWQPILSTALQKLSARRFRSAQEMREAILTTARTAPLFDSGTGSFPLLKPITLPYSTAFQAQCQEKLRFRKMTLCVTTNQPQTYLFRGGGQQATFQSWKKLDRTTYFPHPEVWHLAPLSSPIVELVSRPQGCFIVAEKSLHLVCPDGQGFALIPQLIQELPPLSQVAIEAKGRWFAALMPDFDSEQRIRGQSLLRFYRLSQIAASMKIDSNPLRLSLATQATDAARLLALDAHHVATLTDIENPANSGTSSHSSIDISAKQASSHGTEVQIFCRRGQRIGALILPLRLKNVLMTATLYRLIAVDRDNPCAIVMVDLKPYRIWRIGVEITPDFLAVAPWGFLLANREGKIVLLDAEGQKVGCLTAPEPITAITALEQHQLTIATWDGSQGNLYTVNLKEVDVDLIF